MQIVFNKIKGGGKLMKKNAGTVFLIILNSKTIFYMVGCVKIFYTISFS
jgi:hypothetical protein